MSRHVDIDQALSRWMADGPSVVRDAVIDAALDEARHTRQRGARFAPWRYLSMTATPIRREGRSFAPVLAAAALLLVVATGAFLFIRPDLGIGDLGGSRVYTRDEVEALAAVPESIPGLVPADVSGSGPYGGLHLPAGHPSLPVETYERFQALLYEGVTAAPLRFYDVVGASGDAVPVTEPGGSTITLVVASYRDELAAATAFGHFIAAYETWEFAAASETWDHGEEGVVFPYSLPADAHGRCFQLGTADDACPQELRVWRQDNLIVTVLQEGNAGVKAEDVVAAIDAEAR
jgi:hypothetical protein